VHVGPRATFPLAGMHADTFARGRILLVGEAAHLIPPIGAQGLNLAIRDCIALTEILGDLRQTDTADERLPGLINDPGHPDRLDAYNQARKSDIRSRSAAVDLMNRSLISGFVPLQAFRSLGLHLIKGFGPIKKFFMEQGLGATSLNPVDRSAEDDPTSKSNTAT
ncbi:MAG: FAD-dependent monooxygenase, partial [Methyloligellaceae bacterium]